MTKKIIVLVSGSGSNLQAIIDECQKMPKEIEIDLVLSNKPSAFALVRAREAKIPVMALPHTDYQDRKEYDEQLAKVFEEYNPDYILLAGFMRILTADIVESWHNKIINIHPSLLPAFKGLDTHARAIEAGVRFAGCTIHFVRSDVDCGPIIIQSAVPIQEDDTKDSLAERVLLEEHKCYRQLVRWIADDAIFIDEHDKVIIDDAEFSPYALANPMIGEI